jgi:ATP-dependent Lon protease
MQNILIYFLKKVKFKIKQYINFKNQLYFFKKTYWNIINNLTELNLINYYKDFNYYYLDILKITADLNEYLNIFPEEIKLNQFNNTKYYKILIAKEKIYLLLNYISPKDLNFILDLYHINLQEYFTDEENVQLMLYSDFIRPIYIWDSEIHYPKKEENNNKDITEDNSIIRNVVIENILNINDKVLVKDDIIINTFFELNEAKKILGYNKLVIEKNMKSINLLDNKYGCSIYLNLNNRIIVIQGIFKDDLFNIAIKNPYAKRIIHNHYEIIKKELNDIPLDFIDSYFNIINLRDKIILSSNQIVEEIKKKYNDFKNIQGKPLMLLINEFLLGSKFRKIDILTLFLISNNEDKKLAYVLFDVFKSKDKKNVTTEIYNSLHHSIRRNLDIAKLNIEKEDKMLTLNDSDITYERRINLLSVNNEVKLKAIDKLKSIKNNFQGDSKAQSWLDGLLKIPFNIYNENEIMTFKKEFLIKLNKNFVSDYQIEKYLETCNNSNYVKEWQTFKIDKMNYLKNVRNILDNSVFGHKEAKIQLERIFAQWINGESKGAVLGLHGPPGTGKTSLIKNGLSKCLARPFAFLPIGGSVNGSTLVGHNYTYVGSTWGRIVDILMTSKCMNPIIFIDELDKVSNTENGKEIISILTHLTDSTQNDEFEDKFFAGVKLDLSKALIIFSFNDISLIDYILKDRITIIETHPLKINEKLTILRDFIIPEILTNVGFCKEEIIINDDLIIYLIETYTLEAGVRKIKEKIVDIIREINLKKYFSEIDCPYTVTREFCDELFALKPKIKIKKIINEPTIGIVNGLYASVSSIGGITFIQAIKFPAEKMLDLNVTGSLGEAMKESVQYALKLAFTLLPKEKQYEIISNEKAFGIHIHCPEGAVKKDGPSAGAAITLAIYSLLMDIKINNKIALTGEIDLVGNITAIGGLETKLWGAKKAGVEIVLCPEENLDDIEIMKKEGNNPEDDNFKIIPVNNIKKVLELCLV